MSIQERFAARGGHEGLPTRQEDGPLEFSPDRLTTFEDDTPVECAPGIYLRGTYTDVDGHGSQELPVISFLYADVNEQGHEETLERLVVLREKIENKEFVDAYNKSHNCDYYEGFVIGKFDPTTNRPTGVISTVGITIKSKRHYEVCIHGGSRGENPFFRDGFLYSASS